MKKNKYTLTSDESDETLSKPLNRFVNLGNILVVIIFILLVVTLNSIRFSSASSISGFLNIKQDFTDHKTSKKFTIIFQNRPNINLVNQVVNVKFSNTGNEIQLVVDSVNINKNEISGEMPFDKFLENKQVSNQFVTVSFLNNKTTLLALFWQNIHHI